jgi:hypothetical protein
MPQNTLFMGQIKHILFEPSGIKVPTDAHMYMIRNKTKGPHFQLLKYTIIRYNRIRKFSVSNIKEKQAGALLLKNHKLYLPKPTASEPFMILSLLHLRMNILQYNKISKIKQFYFFGQHSKTSDIRQLYFGGQHSSASKYLRLSF